jgi:hypothetical protein
MNKVIIVGHPSAGCEKMLSMLNAYGVSPALPSSRTYLSPQEVTKTILDRRRDRDAGKHPVEAAYTELLPDSDDGQLLFDLLVANKEQACIGWHDPLVLPLLKFLYHADPHAVFLLVYESPSRILGDLIFSDIDLLDGQSVQELVDEWISYNRSLLRFANECSDRSVVLHSGETDTNDDELVRLLIERFGLKIKPIEPGNETLNQAMETEQIPEICLSDDMPPMWKKLMDSFSAAGALPEWHIYQGLRSEPIEQWVHDMILSVHPQAVDVFRELQNVAAFPCQKNSIAVSPSQPSWEVLIQQSRTFGECMARLLAELERGKVQLEHHQEEYRLLLRDLEKVQTDFLAKLDDNAQIKKTVEKQKQEHEKNLRIHKKQKKTNAKLRSKIKRLKKRYEASRPTGAAERVKKEASYRVGEILARCPRSLKGLIRLPIEIRNELQCIRVTQPMPLSPDLPPLEAYKDWPEALTIQKQLPYRLGKAITSNTKFPFGWICMPFSLIAAMASSENSEVVDKKEEEVQLHESHSTHNDS